MLPRRRELIIAIGLLLLLAVDLGYALQIERELHSATYQQKHVEQEHQSGYSVVAAGVVGFSKWLVSTLKTHDALITALATVALAVFTYTLWRATRIAAAVSADAATAAKLQAESMRLAERAYVKMSHSNFEMDDEQKTFTIKVEVKNWGRTPARVLAVSITSKIWPTNNTPLPHQPEYVEAEQRTAFLVAGEPFYFWYADTWHVNENDPETMKLVILGYVDYEDVFGRTHRAGYGRHFNPFFGPDLVYIDDPGYNYDREL